MSRHTSLLAAVLTALAAFGCGSDHPTAELSTPPSIRADLTTVERSDLPIEVELAGSVEAAQLSAVSTRTMAAVVTVHATAGDRVEKGQLLLEIDPDTAKGQLAQTEGALAQARAGHALAERNYERFQALAASDAASELELDLARMQFEQASGAVAQAEGAVRAASSVAGDSRVVAPFGGRVVQRLVDVGDLAAPGRPLFMIESGATRRLAVPVPEQTVAASGLAVGTAVWVSIDARPELGRVSGTVAEMTPGADPLSHSFLLRIDLPVEELATGSAGRAFVVTGSREVVSVPATALVERGGLSYVVVRLDDGTTSNRVVSLGARLGEDRREVLAGLGGDETILVGLGALPPAGSPVEASR